MAYKKDEIEVNYWKCKYADLDVSVDEDGSEAYHYNCNHQNNFMCACEKDNKLDDRKDYCELLIE